MGSPGSSPNCLCLDIETTADRSLALQRIGAWRPDTDRQLSIDPVAGYRHVVADLDALTGGAEFVLGHNLLRHDLPVLRQRFPQLRLLDLPVIDTLEISPIAFPQNPYHRLVKDYKLVTGSRNDPLRDARLALRLWEDEIDAFERLQETAPELLACYHWLLTRDPQAAIGRSLSAIRRAPPLTPVEVADYAAALNSDKVCRNRMQQVLDTAIARSDTCKALAYLLAWLRVSGGNSVLPPWVHIHYPQVRVWIRELRETPCGAATCEYCGSYLDPRKELERHFGFPEFRREPQNSEGGSLQEDVVQAAYAGSSLLAILPTGAGKSIGYQLPGLSRHWRSGILTVIISPLQSLMKDQVDNLVKQGIFAAAALNGLLTPPERRDVLERVRLGDVGLLLVSPEQLRNKAFRTAIRYREIGAWVLDEAHCLSKWGHDFRPDYLYVSRFIRERHGDPIAPVWCYTATAKREVIDDLRTHFRESLGIELACFDGGHHRDNLHYEVMPVTQAEKYSLIHRLLEAALKDDPGGAIVFAARRASCEEIAGYLQDLGWNCAYFHAGMDAARKKEVQDAFIAGEIRVIVATNAFGMGVDKPDVRLVIHAEIPGSLENYLQEAGRAGRDSHASRCVLLYDEQDVEAQFGLMARSQLSRKDIAGILRALRRYSAKTESAEVVVTPGEILADEAIETGIEPEDPDADTKVRTAIAWLERARFLQRDEDHTRVFPGSLRIGSLEEAGRRLGLAGLSDPEQSHYLQLLSVLMDSREDEGISTDELMTRLGLPSGRCIRMLQRLDRLGLLSNDLALTVLLRKAVKDASPERLHRLVKVETALIELLRELAPDAESGAWQDMGLRAVCQEINTRSGSELLPDQLLTLMRSLARPFGDEGGGRRAMFDVRLFRREVLRVRLLRAWSNIQEISERRRVAASLLCAHLMSRLDAGRQGVNLRVECKMGELAGALRADLAFGPGLKDEITAIEAGLLYLHDNGVLILDRGKTVFRRAMTIRIYPEARPRRFTAEDYEPLKAHYRERSLQVHVIQEYARLGLQKLSDALYFVLAYFTLPRLDFIRRYFAGRREMLERATSAESYRRIVEDLRHPLQQRIVAERPDANRLILAGPGSGKTRVIVHRIAFLLRVLREPAHGIVVLAFNRAAAWEIRRRLQGLVGHDATGVTVLTYHGLALRLTGTSLAGLAEHGLEADFDGLLDAALALLEGRGASAGDLDELRERLLAGYRYILVDEYQDIDARQYALIGALAGRTLKDSDAKLTLLAVGDDDQNIYAFRNTSNEFIRRFQQDYQAETEYLVENYRSTRHVITAANRLISANTERMKQGQPIRINHDRAGEPAGGRWERLDPLVQGRVHILDVPVDPIAQAECAMAEIRRLKGLDHDTDWSEYAILARNRATLAPIRAWCELEGVRYCMTDRESGQPRLHQTREGRALHVPLKAKPQRRIRHAALRRWFDRRFAGCGTDNPWMSLLDQFIDEVRLTWPEIQVPSDLLLDALYEFGNEARRSERGRIVLSTVHAAKGREFRHVMILDGGDWRQATEEERRLYYVGMTRARETLTLCQSLRQPNPFTPALNGNFLCRSPLPAPLAPRPGLALRYRSLGLADVDLGYAGRQRKGSPIHRALQGLAYGSLLTLVVNTDARELRDQDNVLVGRIAKATHLPAGQVRRVSVESIVWRSRSQTPPEYRDRLQVDGWWVVLPMIVLV